jgi:hypothetical protein
LYLASALPQNRLPVREALISPSPSIRHALHISNAAFFVINVPSHASFPFWFQSVLGNPSKLRMLASGLPVAIHSPAVAAF